MKLEKRNVEDIRGLSPIQEAMFFHYLSETGDDLYFEQVHLVVSGEISIPLFKKAWELIIDSNEMLRTVFRWEGLSVPVQVVLKSCPANIAFYNLCERHDAKDAIAQLKEDERKRGFDLTHVPFRILLCQEEENIFHLIISHHHILYDGWSNSLLLKEFMQVYNHLRDGEELTAVGKSGYKEFIKYIQKSNVEKKYWMEYLKDYNFQNGIIGKKNVNIGTGDSGIYQVVLSPDLKEDINSFVKEVEVTEASMFFAAWGLFLQKYNSCSDVVMGTTVSGRNIHLKGIDNMIGTFINTIPLRVKTESNVSCIDFVIDINKDLEIRNEYGQSPLVQIKKCIELDHGKELFDSIVIVENYPVDYNTLFNNDRLKVVSYQSFDKKTSCNLTVEIKLFHDYIFNIKYKKTSFSESEITSIAEEFIEILGAIIRNPDKCVENLIFSSDKDSDLNLEIEFDF